MSETHPLTTTTFDLPGYRVVKSFGVVRGIIVRSRSIIGNIGANLQSLFGGNISLYTTMCERARGDAFNDMLVHAGQLGANAVIGVRYDATEIAVGITEVLCYGTAVFVEPVQGGQGFVPPPVQGPPAWVTESQKPTSNVQHQSTIPQSTIHQSINPVLKYGRTQ
jgi:uncharacterized protein YbjQ (UPF0145 family)